MFVLYLALGPVVYLRGAAQPDKAALPMASWSVRQIEAQSRQALHVLGTVSPDTAQKDPADRVQRFLPDLKPLTPNDIYTVGSRAGGDLRLKFATTIYNAGRGPLETRGARNPRSGALEVYQYVYEDRRAVKGRPVGTFNYNHRHGHLHFDDFARYELWALDARGRRTERVAANAKVGFCLMDIKNMASTQTHLESGLIDKPGGPVYAGCRRDIQGISVGWGDEYLALLFEQDLELTGVPGGDYALVVTTNPQRQLEELRYDNNAAVAYITLSSDEVVWSSEAAAAGG